MKFIYATTFIIFAAKLAHAGVHKETYLRDDRHPGKCVIGNVILKPGQSAKHPTVDCAEVTCDNSNGLATIETCDPVSALGSPLKNLESYPPAERPKCTWGDFINTKASFPECCKRHYQCVL